MDSRSRISVIVRPRPLFSEETGLAKIFFDKVKNQIT